MCPGIHIPQTLKNHFDSTSNQIRERQRRHRLLLREDAMLSFPSPFPLRCDFLSLFLRRGPFMTAALCPEFVEGGCSILWMLSALFIRLHGHLLEVSVEIGIS